MSSHSQVYVYSTVSLSVTVWPKFAVKILTGGFDPKSLVPMGDRAPFKCSVTWDCTSVPAKWHHIPSNGFSRVHECNRQTDEAGVDASVMIGGIADVFSDAALTIKQ